MNISAIEKANRNATEARRNDRSAWLERISGIGDAAGYFEPLGKRHWAFFVDESPTLLVTFEQAENIRQNAHLQLPAGMTLARSRGWSHLCLIAEGPTWYRDPAVFGYFDRLVDDGFFEDFDRVVFYGAGMGAYAACSFSVTAPGATVIAVQPVATLDPEITGWDPRFRDQRILNFTDRYGYAPDMIEGAGDIFLLFDPEETLDAMQAALFGKPFVRRLKCFGLGSRVEDALRDMQVLNKLIEAAGDGELDPALFASLYRARRTFMPYLRRLGQRLGAEDRLVLEAMLCRNVAKRMNAPLFARRLAEIDELTLKAQQVTGDH